MKKPQVFLLSALALLLACSEDSTTGPEDDDTYTLEATETVGAAGDTVAVEDFSLVIPPGAFSGDQTLRLYASSKDRPFDQNQVTRSFRLEGLPAEYDQPLRVSIKYEGVLSGETFLAHGEQAFDYMHGDTTTVFRLHAASDSSGCLVAEIPATQEGVARLPANIHLPGGTANDASGALELLGLKGHGTRETEHFAIHYPQDLVTVSIPSVGAMLEEIYTKITNDMQLPWPWVSRMHVVIKDIGLNRGAYCGFFVGTEGPTLNLSSTYLSGGNFTPVRIDAGKWLMGLVLGTLDQSAANLANFWLVSAVSSWSEGVFTDDAAYQHPAGFPGEEMAPFNGMRAGAGEGSDAAAIRRAIEHGRGMSAVIKYLTDDPRFTTAGIGSTYETIFLTGCNATAALLNNVNALVAEWWPQFFRSYVGSEIYGVGKDVFTNSANLSGSWTIATGNDSVKVFSARYPDLSAKLYMLNLNFPTIDETADMLLTFGGQIGYHEPWGVMAFGVGATSLEYWGHTIAQGSTSLQIPGLRSLYDAGWRQILVVAICSNPSDTYLQSTDADLEIRITEEEDGTAYNSFDFMLRVVGHWRMISGDYSNEYEADLEEEPWGLVDVIPGEMTGAHEFEGSFNSQGATGEVIATLNAARDTLLSVHLIMNSDSPSGAVHSHSFVATGVPMSSDDASWTWFLVRGAAVCDYLADVQYEHHIPAEEETVTLLDYHCTDEGTYPSFLALMLHKQPR